MKISRIIKTVFMLDFVAGLLIAIKKIFKPKKKIFNPKKVYKGLPNPTKI